MQVGKGVFGAAGLAAWAMSWAVAFPQDDRDAILAYWNAPGRYRVVTPPGAEETGAWRVGLTVEGSKWLWSYNRARGLGKVAPTVDSVVASASQAAWEAWIDARVARDRWLASVEATRRNREETQREFADPSPEAADPGPAPEDLVSLAGDPPPFAEAVRPNLHVISFDDGLEIEYTDHPAMRPRFAYYRFPQGVMQPGKRVRELPADDLRRLFEKAQLTAPEQRIMAAVSLLEGGFESVNTYDTGYVSVGLIQFAALQGGAGSLGQVLRRMRYETPEDFRAHFQRFGVDVTDAGVLRVLDPRFGEVREGPDANLAIIDDKRLIAVFQRAGMVSEAFRVAQIRVAKALYFPANDSVEVPLKDGSTLSLRVGDLVKSESGLATLMDRKVNTGTLGPIVEVLAEVAAQTGARKASDFAKHEAEIVSALRYRKDYLADATLSQPEGVERVRTRDAASRGGRPRKPRNN